MGWIQNIIKFWSKLFKTRLSKIVVNLFIFYEFDTLSQDLNTDFTLKDGLFWHVKLTKNAEPDKHIYTGYGTGFDLHSEFLLPDSSMAKNVIIFGVDMSSSVHIDNKKKDVLILGKGPTQGLDDATITAQIWYWTNFLRSIRKCCLSLQYNGSNSFLFANATKIYQFKANDSKIKEYPFCFGNISKDFTANNMKKKTGLNGYV